MQKLVPEREDDRKGKRTKIPMAFYDGTKEVNFSRVSGSGERLDQELRCGGAR